VGRVRGVKQRHHDDPAIRVPVTVGFVEARSLKTFAQSGEFIFGLYADEDEPRAHRLTAGTAGVGAQDLQLPAGQEVHARELATNVKPDHVLVEASVGFEVVPEVT
jgi:hypothetical protein